MKKILVIFLALFCFIITGNAQTKTCKVSGDDNASVVFTVSEINGKAVTLAINSDSSKPVNITFYLTVKFKGVSGFGEATKPCTITVAPYQTTTYTVYASQEVGGVTEIKISGARCEKVY